jgi:hypothetical protein
MVLVDYELGAFKQCSAASRGVSSVVVALEMLRETRRPESKKGRRLRRDAPAPHFQDRASPAGAFLSLDCIQPSMHICIPFEKGVIDRIIDTAIYRHGKSHSPCSAASAFTVLDHTASISRRSYPQHIIRRTQIHFTDLSVATHHGLQCPISKHSSCLSQP